MKNFYRALQRGSEWVAPLVAQLNDIQTALPEEEGFPYPPFPVRWRKRTEWTHKKSPTDTPIYNEYNIPLRYVTLGINNTERRLFLFEDERARDEWTRPVSRLFKTTAWPLVWDLMHAVGAEHVGHVIMTRLPPGGVIASHIDTDPPIPGLPYWQRYQIPLQGDKDVIFRCGNEELWLEPGSAYWFAGTKEEHSVYNNSNQYRLSMVVLLRRLFS